MGATGRGIVASMALPFADREEAGRELARALESLRLDEPLVLGVPRGGVAVAAPVARALAGELDVIVVRKVGAPTQPELGIGAVGAWGEPWLDERLVQALGVPSDRLRLEIDIERAEARRRVEAYRVNARPADTAGTDVAHPDVEGRDVVVVDDGIATGGTVITAARLLRVRGPSRLVLAVPVAPAEGVRRAEEAYDDVVAVHTPEPFYAVGQWYRDFHQVSDDEVRALLAGVSQDR